MVCKACKSYQVILHDYCLMSNHFHLLIETKIDNLSLFMKHINSNYAIYANKKQNRSGHFWQGRFYSRYITNDDYYYTLIRYIEQNPIGAKIVKKVGEYPYTLGAVIVNGQKPILCTYHSKLLQELDYENIQEMIGVKLRKKELELLDKIKKQKIITTKGVNRPAYQKTLKEYFAKQDRNDAIISALKDGYTQAEISRFIGVSRSLVCKIIQNKE